MLSNLVRGLVGATSLLALVACGGSSGSSQVGSQNALLAYGGGQPNLVGTSTIAWLNGTWMGDQSPALAYSKDSFQINTSGSSLTITQMRQVGADGDTVVPYPTTCLYTVTSNNFVIFPQQGSSAPYEVFYSGQTMTLVNDPGNSSTCGAFVARSQSQANAGQLLNAFLVTQSSATQLTSDSGEIYNLQQ